MNRPKSSTEENIPDRAELQRSCAERHAELHRLLGERFDRAEAIEYLNPMRVSAGGEKPEALSDRDLEELVAVVRSRIM